MTSEELKRLYVKTKIAFEVDGKLTPITGIPDLNQSHSDCFEAI